MTEDSGIQDDDYLVRVKAQVMTRDDSTGGWVPMEGGGMSIVGLRKRVISTVDDIRHEYLIHGERMADQSVVLHCVLKKDVQYTKATPTFHHWKTEDKRFGLTFQSSADARAFDKGVKRAVEDLLEGSPESNDLEVGDDEVFMTLELPFVSRKDSSSQSASTASTTTSSPSPQSPALSSGAINPAESFNPNNGTHIFNHPHNNHHHLHRVHYISKRPASQPTSPIGSQKSGSSTKSKSSNDSMAIREEIWVKAEANMGSSSDKIKLEDSSATDDNIEIVDNSYVQFENRSAHEYSYPNIDSLSKGSQHHQIPLHPTSQARRDSISSLKKHNLEIQPPLPTKSKKKKKEWLKKDKRPSCHLLSQRSRCVYCREVYVHDDNHRGACEDAPDKVGQCIERVSCINCARGMLYHCVADADGDYVHPCVCDSSDETNCKKWTALTILSILVPCLWCYWPLTACHRCGVGCGCCGGRHKAT